MWATPFPNPGWTSLQQANFQNVPHDEVDWASLAKQWIAQREVVGFTHDQSVNPPPPPLENVVLPPPPPPPQDGDQNEMEISDEENGTHREHGFRGPPPPGVNNSGGWGWNERPPWDAPPPNWGMQPPLGDNVRPPNFDFNQGSVPFPDSYDYNHGSEPPFGFDQPPEPPPADFNSHYWSPHQPHHDGGPPVTRHPRHQRNRYHSPPLTETEDSGLDAQKRKQLPAWIREGLEKMERAKQKKEEKERLENEEARLKQENAEKEAAREMIREKSGDGPAIPKRSRFDSDDEDEETVKQVGSRSPSPLKSQTEVKKPSPSPEREKSEEERQLEMMTKVRKWMMEILLEVTGQEIEVVAKDVYYKARNQAAKAPARQLAKSSALASLSTLGLGYESDSEHSGSDTDKDSDAELQESIRCKKEAFERQHSKIFSDDEEYDAEAEAEKQTPEFLKNPISDRHSNPFHNKYDSIPGLDVPSGNDSKKEHIEKAKEAVSSKSRTKKAGTESDSGSSSVDSSSSSSDSETSSTSSTSNELGSGESDSQSEGQTDVAYSKIRTQSYEDEHVPKAYRNAEIADRHVKREKPRKGQKGNDRIVRSKNRETHRIEMGEYKDESENYRKEHVYKDDRVSYEKREVGHRHGDSYGEEESNNSDWREQDLYREERHRSRSRSKNRSGKRARSKEHRARDKYKSRDSRDKYEEYKEYKHKKRDTSRDRYAEYDQEKSRRESEDTCSSSKSKSRKKRKRSPSLSIDDEYDRRGRSNRDVGSSKHSYRDKHYDDEYNRGGKKSSRKHKSRSRSRSSGRRR